MRLNTYGTSKNDQILEDLNGTNSNRFKTLQDERDEIKEHIKNYKSKT